MNDHYQLSTHRLYQKFQKVCRQLERLMQAGKAISSDKIASLRKRRSRYAKQILSSGTALLKTGGAAAFSLLLATQVHAQNCNAFINADSANPVRRPGLPQNLIQPMFVDIDSDGDLDCYEANADQDNGGSSYMKITFLRNNGSKKVPYFETDTASGFGKLPNILLPYNADVSRTTFVDIDGDGDYDCFIGSYNNNGGSILFYKNVGTAAKPKFVETTSGNPLGGIHGSYGLQMSFADLDNDGDYDLAVTDLYHTELYKNTGTKTNAVFQQTFQTYITIFGRLTLYDYNKDGLTDALSSRGSSAYYYKNIGTPTDPKFKADKNKPVFPSDFSTLFAFADLNNDGFVEAYSLDGDYVTTAPVATIASISDDADYINLQAYPDSAVYTYRWRKDGKIIPGQTSPNLNVSEAGKYMVEITGSCGTGISLPYVVTKTQATQSRIASSFAKPMNAVAQPSLKAYPNPFTSQFTLHLGNNYSANTIIKISDVQGRIISSTKANSNVMQLGSNLPKGIYIVQVIQNNAVVLTQKMIKE